MSASVTRRPSPRGSGDQLRAELIEAARLQLIDLRDPAPVSLRAVARTVGVSPTAVYLHFESVEELIRAVILDQDVALRDAVGLRGDEEASIEKIALRYVDWGLANPGTYQLLFESADRLGQEVGPGTPAWDLIETIADILATQRSLPLHEATVLAIRGWSAVHGLVSLRIHKPTMQWPTTPEQEVTAISEALLASG